MAGKLPSSTEDTQDSATEEQLVRLLYTYAPATLLASLALIPTVIAALWSYTDRRTLIAWGSALTLLTVLRLALVLAWKKTRPALTTTLWAQGFTIGSFLSGIGWASLIVFYSTSLPTIIQLFILVVMVALPIAGMPGNAIYFRAYHVFAVPILITLVYWSFAMVEGLSWQFGSASIMYFILILITAHAFHRNLRGALEIGIQNQRLAEKLEISNKQLEKMAYHDPLTGLANRRWFQEQTQQALERSQRHTTKMALLLLDLDNFKQVNDEFGHEAGDQLLITVAERLRHCLRQTDTVVRKHSKAARYGGDEFVILLEDFTSVADLEQTATRILQAVSEPITINEKSCIATVSMGIAIYPDNAHDMAMLMRQADNAMYHAKAGGRNQLRFFRS